jgi:hypothetical protein
MKFDIEGKAEIIGPTPQQITRALKSLRSYGKSTFASLTNSGGSYVQVAGGAASCLIERYDFDAQRWRAFHDEPSPVRPDGTILVFRSGNVPMRADEWFTADQVVEVFSAFFNDAPYPPFIHWRPAPGF